MLSTRRRGFTLIELLVVLAIIAVLAAILFPVFAMVRRKARMTADVTALHQVAEAMAQYLLDHNQMAPPTLNALCKDGAKYVAPGDLQAKRDGARICSYQDDGYGNVLYNLYGLSPAGFAVDQTVYFDPAVAATAPPQGWPAWQNHGIEKWSDFPMMRNKQRPKYTIVTTSRYNQSSKDNGDPPYDDGPILVLRVDGTVKPYADKAAVTLTTPDATSGLTPFEYQSMR